MKNIETIGLTEMTYSESIETEGGIIPAIIVGAAVFSILSGMLGVIAFGYWAGKCIL